jgi:hypothetical protein
MNTSNTRTTTLTSTFSLVSWGTVLLKSSNLISFSIITYFFCVLAHFSGYTFRNLFFQSFLVSQQVLSVFFHHFSLFR